MNGDTPGLEFRCVPQMLTVEPSVGIRESVKIAFCNLHGFDAPIGLSALQAVKPPNFRNRRNAKEWNCLTRVPS